MVVHPLGFFEAEGLQCVQKVEGVGDSPGAEGMNDDAVPICADQSLSIVCLQPDFFEPQAEDGP